MAIVKQTLPLYQQVYQDILSRIQSAEWKPGDKLPSVRTLARERSIHRLTVLKAYQLLMNDDWVYVKDKSGYYVGSQSQHHFTDHSNPIVHSLVQKNHLSEIHQADVTFQFSKALIDPALLPNQFFSKYVKDIFDKYPKVLSTYAPLEGDRELRMYLAQFFHEKQSLMVNPEQILITSGAQQAIHLIAEAFISPKDVILMERPCYGAAMGAFRQQGASIIPVDIFQSGYDLSQIESYMKEYKPKLFYCNPTFHNPTGYTIPDEQRKQLVDLARDYQCFIVEDDSFYDMYFDEPPPHPIFKYDTDGFVIYIRGFSKYIAPGLRIAAITCHPIIKKDLLTIKSLIDNGSPLLTQKIFLHYFQSERMRQHIEKLRIALQIRKETMEFELRKTSWNWVSPNGGLNLWVECPSSISIEKLLKDCLDASISFVPGSVCDPKNEMNHYLRLNYSYNNEGQIHEGMKRLIRIAEGMG
ncbi:PLP-dependent aminotransferase family protein [Terrilactibacillus laevilacticus]|uniref:aminotransferase-like domain-containing protein n=1 Tax=Terrilactibacillus laevilacticus TaxID=1380157 RepID=UPI001146FE47|nr:PLP-dependent aminotransferase family protein [Terrilactibacillus laevilacticus]